MNRLPLRSNRDAPLMRLAGLVRRIRQARMSARGAALRRPAQLIRTGDAAPRVNDRALSDAVEHLIVCLDVATVSELRCASEHLHHLLRPIRPEHGRDVIGSVAAFVAAEADARDAAIDRDLTSILGRTNAD